MKIRKQYETDPVAEEEGVWVDIGEGAEVKVARLNNPRHKKALERLRKPYRNILRAGRDLPDEVSDKIAIQGMAEAILLDWRGIEHNDGSEIAYSQEKAKEILTELKDFRDTVAFLAMEAETFRKEALENAAKNSETSSPGN